VHVLHTKFHLNPSRGLGDEYFSSYCIQMSIHGLRMVLS
jgi:hypothetical protein